METLTRWLAPELRGCADGHVSSSRLCFLLRRARPSWQQDGLWKVLVHAPMRPKLLSSEPPATLQDLISWACLGSPPSGPAPETRQRMLWWAGSRGHSWSWSALPRSHDLRRDGVGRTAEVHHQESGLDAGQSRACPGQPAHLRGEGERCALASLSVPGMFWWQSLF